MILLVNSDSVHIPLADESVHCVVTSPPYWGLRDYGLPPLIWGGEAGCRHMWGDETRRGMTGGGVESSTLGVLSGGHGMSKEAHEKSIERSRYDASQGQFCQLCNAWLGCLGLEPTPELYVQHLVMVFREVWRVLRRDGTVWLNLGDSYSQGGGKQVLQTKNASHGLEGMRAQTPNLPAKQLLGIPWLVALALQADGWWLRSDIIWHKPNCMPESVQDRPTTSHEYLFLLAKSKRYFYDGDAIRTKNALNTLRQVHYELSAARKSKADIDKQCLSDMASWPKAGGIPGNTYGGTAARFNPAGRNRRTVWTIPTKPYKGAHFATFPPALVEPCIKAGTSERGVCPECGAQWERMVERGELIFGDGHTRPAKRIKCDEADLDAWSRPDGLGATQVPGAYYERTTTGWQPTCTCDAGEPVPATVLDPFVGSGTTCLVARQFGRRSIGLDLSFAYLRDQARARLELDKLAAWENGKQVEANWEELPLFQTS